MQCRTRLRGILLARLFLVRWGGIKSAAAEHRNVTAEREIDAHGIVFSAVLIIPIERAAQARCFDAHDRIGLRIEIVAAAERFHRDGVALDAVLLAAQGRLNDVAQERDELRRSAKCLARSHVAERDADFIRVRTSFNLRGEYGHCPAASSTSPESLFHDPELSARARARSTRRLAIQPYCTCNRIQASGYHTIYNGCGDSPVPVVHRPLFSVKN